MNDGYMSNLYELENILMDVVRRRMVNGLSTSALTPVEMKAAETLVEIFKIKKDMELYGNFGLAKGFGDDVQAISNQIHEALEEPEDKIENRYYIVKALEGVLKMTRTGQNIESLEYESEHENVKIKFLNGFTKIVDVECDSGIAMIRDILKAF